MDDKPKVTCSGTGYSNAVAVDVSFVNRLADKFCKGDSKKERHMTLAGNDISSDAYKKYTFDLAYTPPQDASEQCDTDCPEAIKAMTSNCKFPLRLKGDAVLMACNKRPRPGQS